MRKALLIPIAALACLAAPLAARPASKLFIPACEAGPFIVFFEWDSARLTPETMSVLDVVAGHFGPGGCHVEALEVSGHADRTGPEEYNLYLSERRAQVVAAFLEEHGASHDALTVEALGETRPMVPTEDGVREPRNRRVEMLVTQFAPTQ